jgi:hypothetical protein
MTTTHTIANTEYRVQVFPHPDGIHKGCKFMYEVQRDLDGNWMRVAGSIAETVADAVAQAREDVKFWIANAV